MIEFKKDGKVVMIEKDNGEIEIINEDMKKKLEELDKEKEI